MNVTWRLRDEALEAELLAEAKKADMDGLKGHRSVGGFRASIYNAFPEKGVQALADLLRDFAQAQGVIQTLVPIIGGGGSLLFLSFTTQGNIIQCRRYWS